jgi:outer membrane biosynthesis protein TonB
MKSPLISLRGAAVALGAAGALTLTGTVAAAPKKTEPAAAVEPAPPPEKKGLFSRTKEKLGLKKNEKPQPAPQTAEAIKAKPAAQTPSATKTAATSKPAPPAKANPAPRETAVVEAQPEKKRGLRGIFSKSKRDKADPGAAAAEPSLAKVKTAKPAPVKEVKPAARTGEAVAAGEGAKEKRGVFGFLRRLREPIDDVSPADVAEANKIERPDDWQEHKVVTADSIALYTFGPSQANGPDKRLDSGTVVKVTGIKRGYALVTVDGGLTGYMDAAALRDAEKTDFRDPVPPAMASLGISPDNWSPLAPPPDLPDQPSAMDADAALLLLPPLEPKPNP